MYFSCEGSVASGVAVPDEAIAPVRPSTSAILATSDSAEIWIGAGGRGRFKAGLSWFGFKSTKVGKV